MYIFNFIYSLINYVFLGVLWINNTAIPGSPEAMNYLRKMGKRIFYVTNNSTKMRSDFAIKAQELGYIAEPVRICLPCRLCLPSKMP